MKKRARNLARLLVRGQRPGIYSNRQVSVMIAIIGGPCASEDYFLRVTLTGIEV